MSGEPTYQLVLGQIKSDSNRADKVADKSHNASLACGTGGVQVTLVTNMLEGLKQFWKVSSYISCVLTGTCATEGEVCGELPDAGSSSSQSRNSPEGSLVLAHLLLQALQVFTLTGAIK